MNTLKAGFITGVVLILGGGFVWSLYRYNIWSYYAVMQVLGWYGFVQAGINLFKWLSKPDYTAAPQTYEEWAEYKK